MSIRASSEVCLSNPAGVGEGLEDGVGVSSSSRIVLASMDCSAPLLPWCSLPPYFMLRSRPRVDSRRCCDGPSVGCSLSFFGGLPGVVRGVAFNGSEGGVLCSPVALDDVGVLGDSGGSVEDSAQTTQDHHKKHWTHVCPLKKQDDGDILEDMAD